MASRPGLAPAFLVAVIGFGAGCAGADSTPAGTPPMTAQPTGTAVASAAPASWSPAASAVVSTPTPQATQRVQPWRIAGELTRTGAGHLVAFDAGYVMNGFGREVFFSPDGYDWQRVELPWTTGTNSGVEMNARIMTMGASGRQVVAVGDADQAPCEQQFGAGGPPPCQLRPVSWVTENGIDWVASEAGDILVEAFAYQQFKHIWPVAGGWDAALGQPLIIPEDSALVHSDDGLHWHALAPVPGTATGDAPAENVDGVGTPDGQRIIWTFNEADDMVRLWRSEGTAWTVLGDLGPEVSITASLGPSEPGQPWLIGAREWGGESPRLWFSVDGIDFEEATLPGGSEVAAGITSLVRWQGKYLALARGSGYSPAAVWSSPDGEEWTPEPAVTEGWPYLEQLVVAPSNLAAVHGSGPDGDDPYARTILLRE